MAKKLFGKIRGHDNAEKEFLATLRADCQIGFDHQSNPIVIPEIRGFTCFEKLPVVVGSIAATSDLQLSVIGTGTEVIARAASGGVNLKSQVTSPADGDNVQLYPPATTTLMNSTIRAGSQLRFRTVLRLNTITAVFASAGIDENAASNDVDPTGTAGDGAAFLFNAGLASELTVDPSLVAGAANTSGADDCQTVPASPYTHWILTQKVNGVDTFIATNKKVVAGQDYELIITIEADLKPRWYIDGKLVGTGVALTADDPVAVNVGLELTATPGGQKDLDVRFVELARDIG